MTETLSAWPHKAHILINPAIKRELKIFSTVILALILVGVGGPEVAKYFIKKQEQDLLLPKMSALAEQGKPEAVVWMAKHERRMPTEAEIAIVRQSAEAGDTQNMLRYANLLMFKKDPAGAGFGLSEQQQKGIQMQYLH